MSPGSTWVRTSTQRKGVPPVLATRAARAWPVRGTFSARSGMGPWAMHMWPSLSVAVRLLPSTVTTARNFRSTRGASPLS